MQELTSLLIAKREKENDDKRFFAALQGVDLDGKSSSTKNGSGDAWEDMKARVFSKGKASDASDIISLQGYNAEKAGFGIGMGLEYNVVKDSN